MARVKRKEFYFIIFFFLFKIFLEIAFWNITSMDSIVYNRDFNLFKYLNGWINCLLIFIFIPHKEKKASTFFLYFKFILEFVPITTIYALGNDNALYYNLLTLSFLICIMLVRNIKKYIAFVKCDTTKVMNTFFTMTIFLLLLYILIKNGLPTLTALDLDNVYELRGSKVFEINKYFLYVLRYGVFVFLPILIAWTYWKKKYFVSVMCNLIVFILYLYTGMKAYLFSIPMILIVHIWGNSGRLYDLFNKWMCIGTGILVIFSVFFDSANKIYSLLIRRTMFVSANNKFKYFDFFTTNPKMGLAGELPRWLIQMDNPYPEGIGFVISEHYYNMPQMNSNTGFMVEGFARFGLIGMIAVFLIFAFLLISIDYLQERTCYSFALCSFIFLIYSLSDGFLLTLIPWGVVPIILCFYFGGRNLSIKKKKLDQTSYFSGTQ